MQFLSRLGTITIMLLILGGMATLSKAQGKSGNKGKTQQAEKKGKSKADSLKTVGADADTVKIREKGNKEGQGKGNAYGRNKGDMSGREFGQARAEAAKKLKNRVQSMDQKITSAEEMAEKARKNILQAEEDLRDSDASEAQKESRQERIAEAKEKLNELEDMIKNEKAKLSKAREKLNELDTDGKAAKDSTSADTDAETSQTAGS